MDIVESVDLGPGHCVGETAALRILRLWLPGIYDGNPQCFEWGHVASYNGRIVISFRYSRDRPIREGNLNPNFLCFCHHASEKLGCGRIERENSPVKSSFKQTTYSHKQLLPTGSMRQPIDTETQLCSRDRCHVAGGVVLLCPGSAPLRQIWVN